MEITTDTPQTLEFRALSGSSADDFLVKSYQCKYNGSSTVGTLYISKNLVCFKYPGATELLKLTYMSITDVQFKGKKVNRKVKISTVNDKIHLFNHFKLHMQCRSSFNLIFYLWNNMPAIVDPAVVLLSVVEHTIEREKREKLKEAEEQKPRVEVDMKKALELQQIMGEVKQMQNEAIVQLNDQIQQTDRIDKKVNEMDNSLKQANHLLNGIESLPYYLFGKVTQPKKARSRANSTNDDDRGKADDTLNSPQARNHSRSFNGPNSPSPTPTSPTSMRKSNRSMPVSPKIEVAALLKCKSWKLVSLVFEEKFFSTRSTKSGKSVLHPISYIDVKSLTIESNNVFFIIHLYNDKHYKFCTSYAQIITHTFFHQTEKQQYNLNIVFNPGARTFQYTEPWLHKMPVPQRGQPKNVVDLSHIITNKETREKVAQVEAIVDGAIDILNEMQDNIPTMNIQIRENINRINNITNNVDAETGKLKGMSERMNNIK